MRPMPESRGGLSRKSFTGKHIKNDVLAGLVNGVISVPDGLAAGALAGVSPVTGLYASITGPIAGGLLQSSHLMSIATTSASAIAAGQAIASYEEGDREAALFLLVLMTGAMLVAMGLLRAGRLVRYVPYSVMQGFLFGVSLVLVLDQSAAMVGYSPEGDNEITQFIDLLLNIGQWNPTTIVIGVLALGLVLVFNRTRLANWASIIGLVVPTVLMLLAGWQSVEQVVDVSPVPRGLPVPSLPDLTLFSPSLVLAAFALAGVIAIQGAGVSQSVENLDGSRISPSADLNAQGVANLAAGLFQGIPVGASVGQTALNVSAGARTRWAAIFSGVWMLVFVVALAPVIERVPMAVLGALMVFAGAASIKPKDVVSVFRTGWMPIVGFMTTLVVSLVASVPLAVVTGVALAIVLNMVRASNNVHARWLTTDEQGRTVEQDPPEALASNDVIVLSVHGNLFFAGAKELEENLPRVAGSDNAVLVLRIRGQQHVGATLIDVLNRYARDLEDAGGRLYLSGVDPQAAQQLTRSAKLDLGDEVHVVEATPVLGESTGEAVRQARRWLALDPVPAGDRMDRPPIVPNYVILPEGALQPPRHDRPTRRHRQGSGSASISDSAISDQTER